jgi:hypothetical protein
VNPNSDAGSRTPDFSHHEFSRLVDLLGTDVHRAPHPNYLSLSEPEDECEIIALIEQRRQK